jgi:outer membrane immunogenic protein
MHTTPRLLKTLSVFFLFSSTMAASFEGIYVGLNADGATGSSRITTTMQLTNGRDYPDDSGVANINALGTGRINLTNFTAGITSGYNWQKKNFLFGLALDISPLNLKNTRRITGKYTEYAPETFTLNQSTQMNWLITASPRLGYVIDRSLFYITTGLAMTQLKNTMNFSDTLRPVYLTTDKSEVQFGMTAGIGAEFLLNNHWSLKTEYQYVYFPSISSSGTLIYNGTSSNPLTTKSNLQLNIIRAGVNYHF